jgi:mono/diheme cytochrome c family protein
MTSWTLRGSAVTIAALVLCGSFVLSPRPSAQTPPAPADTAALYKSKCAPCHLATGDAKTPAMNFADGVWHHGSSVKEVADVIRNGVKGTAMLPFKSKLTDDQVAALAKYVRAFDKSLKD